MKTNFEIAILIIISVIYIQSSSMANSTVVNPSIESAEPAPNIYPAGKVGNNGKTFGAAIRLEDEHDEFYISFSTANDRNINLKFQSPVFGGKNIAFSSFRLIKGRLAFDLELEKSFHFERDSGTEILKTSYAVNVLETPHFLSIRKREIINETAFGEKRETLVVIDGNKAQIYIQTRDQNGTTNQRESFSVRLDTDASVVDIQRINNVVVFVTADGKQFKIHPTITFDMADGALLKANRNNTVDTKPYRVKKSKFTIPYDELDFKKMSCQSFY